jgi:hypothetical protein
MTMDMGWAGGSSTSEAPPSSLPDITTTMPAGDEAELEPWDIIMQEIKDMGLDLDFDMSISPSVIGGEDGGSEYGDPPAHHGFPAVSDQPGTSLNADGGCSSDVNAEG